MVGYGEAMHIKLLSLFYKGTYTARAIQQAVFGMDMKMNKILQNNTSINEHFFFYCTI